MAQDMYCGIGDVPKNKTRGTPEHCARINQVRYYGRVKIGDDILKANKGVGTDLTKETLKLRKYQDTAKSLVKEFKLVKRAITQTEKESEKKRLDKRLDSLLAQKDKLLINIKKQREIVDKVKQETERQRKEEDKEKKKANKKANKKEKKLSKKSSKKTVKRAANKAVKSNKKSGSKTNKRK